MLKKILAFVVMLYAVACFAAVDVNKANAAELDSIKGIGPELSGRILDERKKADFKDWSDFIARVKGVGQSNAAKFSDQGLTVGGASYKGAVGAPSVKTDAKAATSSPGPTASAAAPTVKPAASAAKK